MPQALTGAAAVCFGLLYGSFLNVLIHRLPDEKRGKKDSILTGRSRCPRCRKTIRWYDNVPLVSFLVLGAKCRACKAPISWRYPLVEALTAALGLALVLRWGHDPAWTAVAWGAMGMLVALTFTDFATFIIPDELSLGLLALGLASCWLNPNFQGGPPAAFGASLLGAALGFCLTYFIAWAGEKAFKKDALGGGDIKLLAGVGALFGWHGVFTTLMMGSVFGTVYASVLLLRGKAGRGDAVPFGPFLALGALINLFRLVTVFDMIRATDALFAAF